jgi:hypothetical protein
VRTFALVAAFAVAASLGGAARATSVIALTLPEMTARADYVVHAHVVAQRVADEARGPVTYTTLAVDESIKGARRGDQLVVYQPGVLDGVRVRWVVGAHHFHVGDEVVFFGARHTHAGQDVVIALTPGYGTFTASSFGPDPSLVEDGGGGADASGRALPARTFASVDDLFAEALGVAP